LKRVPVSQLQVGMYVHELCGSWLDHSFWRSRFLIANDGHLSRLRGSKLEWVWIDTDRGRDVDAASLPGPPGKGGGPSARRGSTADELHVDDESKKAFERAQGVRDASGDVVAQMFDDAQLGRRLDVKQIERLAQDV